VVTAGAESGRSGMLFMPDTSNGRMSGNDKAVARPTRLLTPYGMHLTAFRHTDIIGLTLSEPTLEHLCNNWGQSKLKFRYTAFYSIISGKTNGKTIQSVSN
jgi:hypothetical protein